MIHQYQNNGYNIVLDVNSGSVHVVDKIAYDVIGCLEEMNPAHTSGDIKRREGSVSDPETWGYLRGRRSAGSFRSSCRADRSRTAVYTGYL